jgi:hypothetical protein
MAYGLVSGAWVSMTVGRVSDGDVGFELASELIHMRHSTAPRLILGRCCASGLIRTTTEVPIRAERLKG